MKKFLISGISMLVCAFLFGQDQDNLITYSLSRTSFTIEVSVEVNAFIAGPYAEYSEECLGYLAPKDNFVQYRISSIELKPSIEADPANKLTVNHYALESKLLFFSQQGFVSGAKPTYDGSSIKIENPYYEIQDLEDAYQSALLKIPYPQDYIDASSREDKAEAIAARLEEIKKSREDIIMGDTVGDLYGEATTSALKSLKEEEQNLIKLFSGKNQSKKLKYIFTVVPGNNAQSSIPLFRFDEEKGVLGLKDKGGSVVALTIKGEVSSPVQNISYDNLHIVYRVPAMTGVSIAIGSQTIFSTRVPVFQMGSESSVPISKK